MGQSTSLDVAPGSTPTGSSTSGSIGRSFGLSNEFDFIHHQIRRHSLTLRQLTMLTYDDLQSKIKELNDLSSKFVDCNGKQLVFELKDGQTETPVMLWKGLIRIRCIKINPETKGVEKVRDLNLKQFLQVYNTLHSTLVLDSVDSENEDEEEDQCRRGVDGKEISEEEKWEVLDENASLASCSIKNTPRKRPTFNMSTSLILDELQGGALSPSSECCICMENKHEVSLPCAHSYCLSCIEQWNVDHKTCPICREKLENTNDTWVLEDKPNTREVQMEIQKSLFGLTK